MPLSPNPARPLGLVLSGGGARGAFQVGVWHTLRSDPRGFDRAPDVISGTSAGAINGALIAAGLSPEQMLAFWLDLADDPPVVANERFFKALARELQRLVWREPLRGLARRARELRIFRSLLHKHAWHRDAGRAAMAVEFLLTARFDSISSVMAGLDSAYLFSTDPLRARLAKAIGGDALRTTDVRLAINTVDIHTGSVVRIVNHRPDKPQATAKHYRYEPAISLDMILASAAIPLLFNPVRVGGLDLWDGGVLVNSPMAPAVALGAQRIVPVLVTVQPGQASMPLDTLGGAIERLADTFLENAYNTDRKLLLERNALARGRGDAELRDIQLFRAIRPQPSEHFDAGSYLYFERDALLAMYRAGRQAAKDWLDRGPLVDSRDIVE